MPRHQRELSPALGQSKPGPQTRHDAQKTRAAILHSGVSVLPLLQRGEYVRISIQLEACGRNADHGIWFALINERPADGAGIAAKVSVWLSRFASPKSRLEKPQSSPNCSVNMRKVTSLSGSG